MDLEPQTVFRLLKEYSENDVSGPSQCNRLLSNLNSTLTAEQQSTTVLDLYLLHMFDKNHGLLNFVTCTVNKKPFKSTVLVLEILYTFMNNFGSKLETYIFVVNEICLRVIKSSLVAAAEKAKALEVLVLGFEKVDKCIENQDHYNEVYETLRHIFTIKKGDTVQHHIFIALGMFAKKFPYVLQNSNDLKMLFTSQLETQMVQKNISYQMISGIYTGFTYYCESFPLDLDSDEDKVIIAKLYRYIDKMLLLQTRVKQGNRAAIDFFAKNVSLFASYLVQDYGRWHDLLLKWLQAGPDERKVGSDAIAALYRGLAVALVDGDGQKDKAVILYFLKYFKKTVKDETTPSLEKNLSLRGLACFSPIFYKHLPAEEVTELFVMVLQIFEQIFVLTQNQNSEDFDYLPNYVQTVASFMQFKKIASSDLFCLQRGVVNMIKVFPQLPFSHHSLVIEALVNTFHRLKSNDQQIFHDFIDNTIYQGVIWTCSHQHISELELLENSDRKVVTVKSYLVLWKGLLGITADRRYDGNKIYLQDRRYLLIKIVDRLIKTLLILINKLNVTVVQTETDTPLTDIQSTHKVAEINDFAIFLNVVDFYKEMLNEIQPPVLKKCICKLVNHLIMKCIQYPLISGFYKLLSYSLKVCNKLDCFNEEHLDSSQDVTNCYESLTKFLAILLVKTKQYKDDLLIACLQVLLEYPTTIIKEMLPTCVSPFSIVFYVGRTYMPLADMGIETLEHWQNQIPAQEMDPFLTQILPILDTYLQSKSLSGFASGHSLENRRKTTKTLKKRKVVVQIESDLVKLQRKILKFVGQQNSSLCRKFVSDESNIELAVWGNQQHLKVTLPYEDLKLGIYLDKFIPRIIHLALYASDRKMRIAACELLQAVVMVFLGTTKQMSEKGLADVNELLRNVAFPLLQLGCDLDQLVQQLFKPLFLQLIHWYTHVTQRRGSHTAIIIDAVMDGITHPTDSALRDFSGECVNEFIKWTIKQVDESQLGNDPLNIKVLTKKMRFFSTHPDPFKKLGAALIFNNIYREVREESVLLDMFWVEFLHIFVKSLSLVESNTDEEICVSQINQALTHIQRGFVEKGRLFNKEGKTRRVPSDFRSGLLKDVVVWVLEQSGSQSPHCRTKCMELFCNIAPHTAKYSNLQNVIKASKGANWVEDTYETFLVQYPTLSTLADSDSAVLRKWMQAFLCALDGYCFIIKNSLVDLSKVLSNTIVTAIQFFIANIPLLSIDEALMLIRNDTWTYTSFQKQEFNKQKSLAVTKILQLFGLRHTSQSLVTETEVFFSPELWNLMLQFVFNPELLGFDTFLPNSDSDVPLLINFLKKVPEKELQEFCNIVDVYVENSNFTDIDLTTNVTLKNRNIVKGLLALQSGGLKGLEMQKFANGIVDKLLGKFTSDSENNTIFAQGLQNTTMRHCLKLLEFAVTNKNELVVLTNHLYQPYVVRSLDNDQPVTFGMYILDLFKDVVVESVAENFELFFNSVISKDMEKTLLFLSLILNHMMEKKSLKHFHAQVMQNVIQKWDVFEEYFNRSNTEEGVNFVKLLVPLLKSYKQIDVKILKTWLIHSLLREDSGDTQNDLDLTIAILYLIVELLDVEDNFEELRTSLECVKNRFFSPTSPILQETKVLSIEKLVAVIPKIRATDLLVFFLSLFVSIETDDASKMTKLLTSYIFQADLQLQRETLCSVYELCSDDRFSLVEQYRLITSITPLFHYCQLSVFETFFTENIGDIIATLKQATTEDNLVTKIVKFVLIELLFMRIPITSANEEVSPITLAALPKGSKNKQLLLLLLKFTLGTCKDSFDFRDESKEMVRLYKCHSYNAMVSIVSNSMKDPNFYTKLFIRQENDKDIMWKGLIDTEKVYKFATDFESFPNKRTVLVTIRDEISARKRQEGQHSQSAKYLETQRVYNSSLSEDFTKFDFTNTVLRSQESTVSTAKIDVGPTEIELDPVDVNNHECMAIVCGLIEHLVRTGAVQLPEEGEEAVVPIWLKAIRTMLLSEDTHTNVKIFWIKVIDNTMPVFKHFAKCLLEPLLKFVVDKCAGETINYFVADVVAILASWSNDVSPDGEKETGLLVELLEFLIKRIDNERQDIFKYHLELLKLITEAWKSSIRVPYDSLFSKLDVDVASRKVEIGIHLASVFLANNIAPWDENNFQNFCKKLFAIVMNNNLKSTFRPCAETIGLVLKFIKNQPNLTKILDNVYILLKKIKDYDKYASCLECIVLHYPEVANEFHLGKLLGNIHCVPANTKATYLKIIISRAEAIGKLSDFGGEKWDSYLESDNVEIQFLTLEVIYKGLNALKNSPRYPQFLQAVCKYVTNPNVTCRSRMYDILMSVHGPSSDAANLELPDFCKDALVQGLVDHDEEIREKVTEFWEKNANLPTIVSKRFSYILSNLYATATENDFLGYSTYLLLSVLKNSDEYNQNLFEHPLEDCDFEDYLLRSNWRARHLSVVPMFAETLRTFSEDFGSYGKTNFNELRQTQNSLSFAPTQSVRMKEISQFTASQSSLFIKPQADSTFVNPNFVTISEDYKVPKRRFLRDKSKISKSIAQHEVKKSFQKIEKRKDLAKEQENKVTIYRTYRTGDLPDVQIPLSALLAPLTALALHDYEISKILYIEVFNNIMSKMKDDSDFIDVVTGGIKFIFVNSVQFNTNLFRTLFDVILLNNGAMTFDPSLIVSICQSSGLITMGTLAIEEYLIAYEQQPSTSKKRRGGQPEGETLLWVKLAELYKDMEEWDVVKAIFLEKIDCKESVQQALVAESQRQWRDAQDLYRVLIETDDSATKKDFYYESYFKCFAHLGEWENLAAAIDQLAASSSASCWHSLWDQDWNQQKLLPWYINAQLHNTLFTQKSSDQFLMDLNETLNNSENSDYLQNHFAEELCMLWIFQREIGVARQYLEIYMNNFLENWQLLDPVYSNLRYNKLLKLRNVVDISKFVQVFETLSVDSINTLSGLTRYWNMTSSENLPSILLNETKVLYRRQFVYLLVKKIKSFGEDDLKTKVTELARLKFKLDADLIDTAIDQGNYYMARKYYKIYEQKDILRLKVSLSKIACVKASMMSDPDQKSKIMLEALQVLVPALEKEDDSNLVLSAHLQLFYNLNDITKILLENDELFHQKQAKLSELLGRIFPSPNDVALFGAEKLKSFLQKTENNLNDEMEVDGSRPQVKDCKIIGDAYVKLAYFAQNQGNFSKYMLFVLKAMKLDSPEARQLLPCILMEKDLSAEDKNMFIEETNSIPNWMFLEWIPQLLVQIDSPNVSIVAPIVLKIAKTYPQAIMYAYRLSKENYTFKNSNVKNEAKDLVERLDQLLLSDARIDNFLKALSSVSVPAVILIYYVKKLSQAFVNKDKAQMQNIHEYVMKEVFGGTPNSKNLNSMQGNMFKKIASLKEEMKNILRSKDTENKLRGMLGKLWAMLHSKDKYSKLLQDYCPWLSNFSADKLNLDLEIPGQYDGKKLPLTQHHVRIFGFYPNVSPMDSLRKPIKITILGNDTKEYPFLIKFGEDIRQDQRIQQLFGLMNGIFDNDIINQKELSIMTYQVLPLTSSLGIIQWIENTTKLEDFVGKSVEDLSVFDSSRQKYNALICKSRTGSEADSYGTSAVNTSRAKTITNFQSLIATFPRDVLRSSFQKLSANTESFFAMRNNFTKTYAVLCASHWLLGIGDRHLSNSLICVKTGRVLGIDFGHAFGTATQILPIPELVPFRLTPHIVNLMQPIGERGLFRETMVYALKSLRSNSMSLLATMNVFIEEPSLDWLEHASKFDDGGSSANHEWYPAQKIRQVKRKLEGASSVTIMVEDLTAGQKKNENYMKAYVKLVEGTPENDVRARVKGDDLSVEDQVDCLIDHAIDYNLLGRMYGGWMPWV